MTNDQTGRTPRQTTGGSPAVSTIMLIVTVVALVVGFLILRSIRNDGGGGVAGPTPGSQVSNNSTTTSTTPGVIDATTSTTALVDVKTGTKVQVANSSTGSGVAGKLKKDLEANGFTTGKATNGTGANLPATAVYYDPANPSGKPVADTVGRALGGVVPQPLPAAIPIDGGTLDTGVGVLILLGNDKAGKTIAQMSGASATPSSAAVTPIATVASSSTVAAG